ncbi:MAG TPA: DUF1329 domain-containing protein [Candidatus Nanoarchaeia archaeon]|nr:DUF1329 domain-containing protein [Candidatus Nanoarchaeia archaeon]
MKKFIVITAMLMLASVALHAQDATQLKTTFNPLGGEKAGNKDGTIPAWTGGYTKPIPGFKNGGRRGDPFASEKPLFSISAQNMDQYADKLTDGTKAMLKKYPKTYRVDVYKTHRTAAAPQWVYDNTYKNATRAKLVEKGSGPMPEGAYGGIPFPLAKSGAEVMWNHKLRWRGESWYLDVNQYLGTGDGRMVLSTDGQAEQTMPYYYKDVDPSKWNGEYWFIHLVNSGPPIRAGEQVVGRMNVDDNKTQAWVYLTGQRRVRKLPNPCCDTPTPATAGVMSFDELETFDGRMDRFDWKLLGKKEIYIPYNTNRSLTPTKDSALLMKNHLNPDHVRWELHRVWIVEATLKSGRRHQAAKSRYYVDEDSWLAVLGDRWDAKGQLWKSTWSLPYVMPDLPAVADLNFGYYDLTSGAWYSANMYNEKPGHYKITSRWPDKVFTPDAMAAEGVR